MVTRPWKVIVIPVLIGASAFALGMAADRLIHRNPKTPPSTQGDLEDTKKADSTHPDKPPHNGPRHDAPPASMAARLDAYLAKKHSPLKGIGGSLVSDANAYGVDPRLVVAISGAETTFGKAVCGEHNAWNWFHCYADGSCGTNACKSSPFPT